MDVIPHGNQRPQMTVELATAVMRAFLQKPEMHTVVRALACSVYGENFVYFSFHVQSNHVGVCMVLRRICTIVMSSGRAYRAAKLCYFGRCAYLCPRT